MKLNFCTLFDSNYLTRGMAMYESLEKNCPSFHLYIFAFDQISLTMLQNINPAHATVISLREFEDAELLKVKPTRSIAEYCWTCTPSTISFCIKKYELDHCTYVDADLFFYNDPNVLIEEAGSKSVIITSHRYTQRYDQSKENGKYCVQFMFFRNDANGMKVLNWWRDACLEWCYARAEDGKFGDQKYLDDWTTRFEGVHDLAHIGGGAAPWNVEQYDFVTRNGRTHLREKTSTNEVPLVFFHFHGLKLFAGKIVQLCPFYLLQDFVINQLYFPYINVLLAQKLKYAKINADFDNLPEQKSRFQPYTWRDKLSLYKPAILKLNPGAVRSIARKIKEHNYFSLPANS